MKNNEDIIKTALLIDTYGTMLTKKQFNILDLYYNEDLSLSEIGDNLGISRQAVSYTISQAMAQLGEFESNLGFIARMDTVKNSIHTIKEAIASGNLDCAYSVCDDILDDLL